MRIDGEIRIEVRIFCLRRASLFFFCPLLHLSTHTQDWLLRPSLLDASSLSHAADFFFLLYKTYDKCTSNKREAWPLSTHKPNSMNSCSLSHHLKPDKGIAFRPMAAEKTAGIRRGSGPEIPWTSVMMAN